MIIPRIRARLDGPWDAIVIGSGMGGLSAAAILASEADLRVCVLERHFRAGGFTHVFKRPGYEWDVGVHYVGGLDGATPLRALYDRVTGGGVSWAPLPDCYDRIVLGDRAFDLVRGRERFAGALCGSFPDGRDAILAYLERIDAASRASEGHFASRLLEPGDPFAARMEARFHRYSDRTVEEELRPLVQDPVLFDVLTGQCGDYGHTPREASFAMHAMTATHYLLGAHYPIGGPSTLARGAADVIARSGGAVITNASVESIVIESGRARGVRLASGEELRAPIVISAAGARATYERLIPRELATSVLEQLRAIGPSTAHVSLYLGLTASDAELGLDGTNLWVFAPGDREQAFRRFSADPSAPIPVAYVSFPSAKDPSFASRHPGKATALVVVPARIEWLDRWAHTHWKKRGALYDEWKARMEARLMAIVLEHRPQLRGRIAHAELSTPLTTRHFTGHASGEIYGLAHTPARFRLGLRPRTAIEGLFLAGVDVSSCGVGGAMLGGLLAAAAALEARERRRGASMARLTWLRRLLS